MTITKEVNEAQQAIADIITGIERKTGMRVTAAYIRSEEPRQVSLTLEVNQDEERG